MLATSLLLLYVGGSLALPGNKVVRQLLSTPSVIPQACQQDTHAPDPECYDLLQVGDFITQFQQTCDPAVETPGQRCPCVESQGWSSCLIETAQLTAFNGVTPHGPNGPYNYSCFNLANASEPCLVPDFQQPLTAYTERFNLAVSSIESFFLYVQSWYLALSSRNAIPGIASFIAAAQNQPGNASDEITSNLDILLGNLIRAYASNDTTDLDYEFGRLIVFQSQDQQQQQQQQQHTVPPSTALTSAQLNDTQGMQARLVNALNQTYVTLVESWSDGRFVSNLSSKGQLLVENSVLPRQRLAIIAAGKLGSAGMEGN